MIKRKTQLPELHKDLLTELDKLFPEMSPDKDWSEKDCMWKGGQRSVVRYLHEQFKIQNEITYDKE